MTGTPTGQGLPAADNRVDVSRVELQPIAAPAGALGGDHGGPAAEKAIEHDLTTDRAVEDRIGDHCHRLHGRVHRQQIAFLAATGEGIDPGVVPDIAAIAAKPAELDIVGREPELLSAARWHPAPLLRKNSAGHAAARSSFRIFSLPPRSTTGRTLRS